MFSNAAQVAIPKTLIQQIKQINEIIGSFKKLKIPTIVPKDVPMSLPIPEEEDTLEILTNEVQLIYDLCVTTNDAIETVHPILVKEQNYCFLRHCD